MLVLCIPWHVIEFVKRLGNAVACSGFKPFKCQLLIGKCSIAIQIAIPKVALGWRIPLISGDNVPLERRRFVETHAIASLVASCEIELSFSTPLFCCLPK